jgi:hypothetical protein
LLIFFREDQRIAEGEGEGHVIVGVVVKGAAGGLCEDEPQLFNACDERERK